LIRRQLGNGFGDFFDFHVAQNSTAEAWLSDGKGLGARPALATDWRLTLGQPYSNIVVGAVRR
jgi:hypothetical protein